MTAIKITDHSANDLPAVPQLQSASKLVLIDNYDSFTWNVYQYLTLEGANVVVFRNDQVTVQDVVNENPTQIVISPGPGHPLTDSGISKDVIRHFSGKIPILGVCMGQYVVKSHLCPTILTASDNAYMQSLAAP